MPLTEPQVPIRQQPPALDLQLRPAVEADTGLILELIRELAEYERLLHEVVATEDSLHACLFGPRAVAEVLIAEIDSAAVGFALYFHNMSTFLGKPGLYLEDLYVRPAWRGQGVGKALLARLARVACERGCGRMEWVVLDWNIDAIEVYRRIGAVGADEWRIQRLTGDALHALAGTTTS